MYPPKWKFSYCSFNQVSLCPAEVANFLAYLGKRGISKLILQKIIWCFTVWSSEERTPLSKTIFGWSVTIRSIHDGLQSSRKKWVGSQIIWSIFRSENKLSRWTPSAFVSPSGYHDWEWPLKSPVKNTAYGFSFLFLNTDFQNFLEKK